MSSFYRTFQHNEVPRGDIVRILFYHITRIHSKFDHVLSALKDQTFSATAKKGNLIVEITIEIKAMTVEFGVKSADGSDTSQEAQAVRLVVSEFINPMLEQLQRHEPEAALGLITQIPAFA
jgi:hypothetical protein